MAGKRRSWSTFASSSDTVAFDVVALTTVFFPGASVRRSVARRDLQTLSARQALQAPLEAATVHLLHCPQLRLGAPDNSQSLRDSLSSLCLSLCDRLPSASLPRLHVIRDDAPAGHAVEAAGQCADPQLVGESLKQRLGDSESPSPELPLGASLAPSSPAAMVKCQSLRERMSKSGPDHSDSIFISTTPTSGACFLQSLRPHYKEERER